MKRWFFVPIVCFIFVTSGASPAWSQIQVVDDYTIINSTSGPMVCLGKWVQPTDVSLPGTCEGQAVALGQLTAVSARQSAVKLDEVLRVLASIDERLALNNNQVARLVQAAGASQSSHEQGRRAIDHLLDAINKRFETMPKEITSGDLLRKELAKLKQDILTDVEQLYPAWAGSSGK